MVQVAADWLEGEELSVAVLVGLTALCSVLVSSVTALLLIATQNPPAVAT